MGINRAASSLVSRLRLSLSGGVTNGEASRFSSRFGLEAADGGRARAARLVSLSMLGISLSLTALSLVLLALNYLHPGERHVFDYWVEAVVVDVFYSTVGVVIVSRLPGSRIGWLFCATGFVAGVYHLSGQYGIYALLTAPGSPPGGAVSAWVYSWIWPAHLGLFCFLALLFPHGRLPGGRWRVVRAGLAAGVFVAAAALLALWPGPLDGLDPIDVPAHVHNPFGIEGLAALGSSAAAQSFFEVILHVVLFVPVAALILRLGRARGEERQQLKWFVYACVFLVGASALAYAGPEITSAPWISWAGTVASAIGLACLPTAVGIAILKYRLYDIDLLINRTFVYGSLTALVVGLYVLVVGGLGTLLHVEDNLAISLVATGLVAVLFTPARDRLQRTVNRLMYGERDDPYGVVSRLGQRLEATLASDAALETIVETVAQALKLPYVAVALKQGEGFVTAAEYGAAPRGDPVTLPLAYRSEQVGRLLVAPRAANEAFAAEDWRLLEDLARQAGAAVHSVRTTADLQRSRQRLVEAREEERRRLRRDLHDGLGPVLAGLSFGLRASRDLITTHHDPEKADALLGQLKAQVHEAATDVRRLVYGLRPPALDDMGLLAAIREQATNHGRIANGTGGDHEGNGLLFSVEAPDGEALPPLPAAVEVAAYRIAQEAMTNVARHAGASKCAVRLSASNSTLHLEVSDDGAGLPEDRRAGVGLTSMRERAAELGGSLAVGPAPSGGTRVLAKLPLEASGKNEDPKDGAGASVVGQGAQGNGEDPRADA